MQATVTSHARALVQPSGRLPSVGTRTDGSLLAGIPAAPDHRRCSHSVHDVWQHGPTRVCIPDYGPLRGRRSRHSDKCARCRGQCQDAEPQPHGLPRHPFSNCTQRWAVKTASRHCEAPELREDPLVGKGEERASSTFAIVARIPSLSHTHDDSLCAD